MTFSIATWNINSVRLRIDLVVRYLAEHQPDVLCLQETKCPDANFPLGAFRDAGYPHIAINGQKGYHGVASFRASRSRPPPDATFAPKATLVICMSSSAERRMGSNSTISTSRRAATSRTPRSMSSSPTSSPSSTKWSIGPGMRSRRRGRSILVGDLNIAPLEHDVWSHKSLLSVVSHTPIEVDKLKRAQAAGPWVDALRKFVPDDQKLYTWWSYRSPDWSKVNKGRRLDHVWVSPALADSVKWMRVLRDARGWERPSDHAPVMVRLAL